MPSRRQADIAARDRAILAEALRRFGGADWATFTIDQLAAAVGVAKGTIYNHVFSKDALVGRLAAQVLERVAGRALEPAATDDPISDLRSLLSVWWDTHLALSVAERRVVLYVERPEVRAMLPDETREVLEAAEAGFVKRVTRVLQAGISDGVIRPVEGGLLALGPVATMHGAIRLAWSRSVTGNGSVAMRDALLDFILVGMVCTD
jgi:AcrR family transcriptional regulator